MWPKTCSRAWVVSEISLGSRALLLLLLSVGCQKDPQPVKTVPDIAVLTATAGFRHSSIEEGLAWFRNNAGTSYRVRHWASADSLSSLHYPEIKVLVLLNTTGDFLHPDQEIRLQNYVQNGGNIMGIHAATDAEYNWPWYHEMLGASFESHPAIQEAHIKKSPDPLLESLPDTWIRTDEWYNFQQLQGGSRFLLYLDESSYNGGNMGVVHPIAWIREFDGGRIFYTGMGHTAESYQEPHFQEHLNAGLRYLLNP